MRGGAAMLIRCAAEWTWPPAFVANLMAQLVEEFHCVPRRSASSCALHICSIGLGASGAADLSHQAVNICNNCSPTPASLSSFIVGSIAAPQAPVEAGARQDGMNAAKVNGKPLTQVATRSVMGSKDEVDKRWGRRPARGGRCPPRDRGTDLEVALNQAGFVSGQLATSGFVDDRP